MEQPKQYYAFISYKSEDVEWAIWLQHELEHYHLPASLNGRTDIRQELRPVFRDIDELAAGNLPEQIKRALENSQNLVVVCSPQAAASPWVNQEVETFISLGRTDHIYPFIVEGNSPKEFFPPSLFALPKNEERLGGDASKQGRDIAFVKVVAGMLGLGFGSLWNRYEKEKAEEERKQREQRDNLLRLKSRVVSEKAIALIEEGDSYTARLLALEILPTPNNPDFPYTPEAEKALRMSMVCDSGILRGFVRGVKHVAVSPDDNMIAAIDASRVVRVWNSTNGQLIETIEEIPDLYHAITELYYKPFCSFSTNGESILIPSIQLLYPPQKNSWGGYSRFHCKLEIHSLLTEEPHIVINCPETNNIFDKVNYATFDCQDKNILLALERRTFGIWNIGKKAIVRLFGDSNYFSKDIPISLVKRKQKSKPSCSKGHTSIVNYVEFSSDGKRILSASNDNSARIWCVSSGRELCKLEGHKQAVVFAKFSPDGKHVLTVSKDGEGIIWSSQKGVAVTIIPQRNIRATIKCATYCPDGKRILSALSDYTIAVWKASSGKLLNIFKGHTAMINYITCSPNGKWGATASEDFTVRLWDLSSKRYRLSLNGHMKKVHSLDFSSNGKYLASSSYDGTIRIWETSNWNTVNTIENINYNVCHIVFSPNGECILSDSEKGIAIRNLSGDLIESISFAHRVLSVNYSHDGNSILVSLIDGDIKIVRIKKDYTISLLNPYIDHQDDYITYSAFSNNDKYIASAFANGTIKMFKYPFDFRDSWDLKQHNGDILFLLFTSDDKYLISASADNTIKIWNVETRIVERTLLGHTSTVSSLSLSPDGKYLASSSWDGTVKIWDFQSGKIVETLKGHRYEVMAVKFSPDGRTIATASSDCTIKIWDFLPLEELVQKTMEKCRNRKLTPEERRLYYLE